MPRRRRKKDPLLEVVPPVLGLLALCAFIAPGFLQDALRIGKVVIWVAAGGLLPAGLGLAGWAVWRGARRREAEDGRRMVEGRIRVAEFGKLSDGRSATWSMELLQALEWKRLEDLTADLFRSLGYRAETTRVGPDGGIDVKLFKPGDDAPAAVVQCKAWNTQPVGIKPIPELFGVMAAEGVARGYFVTTGSFTHEARHFATGNLLTLIDGENLLERIGYLAPETQADLLETATAGDYTTPSCPRCGAKMVKRTARKGTGAGSSFWGCPKYPRCNAALRIRAEAEERMAKDRGRRAA